MKRYIHSDTMLSESLIENAFECLCELPEINKAMYIESISDKSRTLCEKIKRIHDARTTVRGNLSMYKKQFLICDEYGLLTYITLNNDDDLGELDVIRYFQNKPLVGHARTTQGKMTVRFDEKLNSYLVGGRGDRDYYYLTAIPASDVNQLGKIFSNQ